MIDFLDLKGNQDVNMVANMVGSVVREFRFEFVQAVFFWESQLCEPINDNYQSIFCNSLRLK